MSLAPLGSRRGLLVGGEAGADPLDHGCSRPIARATPERTTYVEHVRRSDRRPAVVRERLQNQGTQPTTGVAAGGATPRNEFAGPDHPDAVGNDSLRHREPARGLAVPTWINVRSSKACRQQTTATSGTTNQGNLTTIATNIANGTAKIGHHHHHHGASSTSSSTASLGLDDSSDADTDGTDGTSSTPATSTVNSLGRSSASIRAPCSSCSAQARRSRALPPGPGFRRRICSRCSRPGFRSTRLPRRAKAATRERRVRASPSRPGRARSSRRERRRQGLRSPSAARARGSATFHPGRLPSPRRRS